MGTNPINLTVRFLLELTAYIAMGFWGWNQGKGTLRFALAFGIPVIAATLRNNGCVYSGSGWHR